uniref:Microtubule-associated protein futsch n=1 Tax=Parascaris univalens TaxID=6257 RepID=A0A915AG55_PARUN
SDQLESTRAAAYEADHLHAADTRNVAEEHHEAVEETMAKKDVGANEAVSMHGLEDTVKGILHDIGVPEEKITQLSQVNETIVKGISDTLESVKSGLVKHDEQSSHPAHQTSEGEPEHKHEPEEHRQERKPEEPEHKHELEEHQEETDTFNFVSGIAGALKQRLEQAKQIDSQHKEGENKIEEHEPQQEGVKPEQGLEGVVSSLSNVLQEGFDQIKKTVEENTAMQEHEKEHKEQETHEKDEKWDDKREPKLEDLATGLAGTLKEGFEHVKEAVGGKISEQDLKHDDKEHEKKEALEQKPNEGKPDSNFGELLTDVAGKLQQGFEQVKQIVDEKFDQEGHEEDRKEGSEGKHDGEAQEEIKKETKPEAQMGFNEFVAGVRGAVRDEMEHLKEAFEQKVTAEEEGEEEPMVKHTVAEGVNVPTHVETLVKKVHVEAKPNTDEKSQDPMKDVLQGLGISEENIQKVTEVKDTIVKGIVEKVEDLKDDLKKRAEEVKGTLDEKEHDVKTEKGDTISAEGSDIKSRLEGIASDVKKGVEDFLHGESEKHEGSVEKTHEDAGLVLAENKQEKGFDEDIGEKFEKVVTTTLTNADKEVPKQDKMESTDTAHVEGLEHHEQEHKEHHEETPHIEEYRETAVLPPHSPIHEAKSEHHAEEKRIEKSIDEEVYESAHTKDDIHANDGLKSVLSPTVCEQLPSAVVEAVPENVLKFSAAPAVHHSAPHATVESPLQHETSVTKTEVKPIMTSSHAQPEEEHEEKVKEEKHKEPKVEVIEERYESKAEVREEKHVEPKAEVEVKKHEEHKDEKDEESSAPAPPLPKSPPPPVPPKTKSIDMTTKECEERELIDEVTEIREETTKFQFKPTVKTSLQSQHPASEPEKPKESEHKPEPPKEHKEEPVTPEQHEALPPTASKSEKPEQPSPDVAPKSKGPTPAPIITPPKVEKQKESESKKAEVDVEEVVEKKQVAPLTTTTTKTATASATQVSATAVSKEESKKPPTPPSEQVQASATATTTTKVEQPTVKDSEAHEVETKTVTQAQPESQSQSAISQKTEPVPAEKAEEVGKSDTLKSKGGESTNGQQQQQQSVRRRCTIL